MKNIGFFLISTIFLFGIYSCKNDSTERALSNSVGKYGEILIVIDTVYENAKTGDILNSIYREEVKGLPQIEPMFRMNTVPPRYFSDMLKRARNIVQINISHSLENSIQKLNDVWAKDQLVVVVNAKSSTDANSILTENAKQLRNYFNIQERQRLIAQFKMSSNKDINEQIKREHNVSMIIPPGFHLMESRSNDFWIKKEKTIGGHQIIQGIFVYYHPYTSDSTFSSKEMIHSRNTYTFKHIEGMKEGSYMTVFEDYKPTNDTMTINNMYTVEYRGLWNMQNDFMGGPFVHYTILNEKSNRIIHADGFVYAPKFSKREYVRELEAILHSLNVQSSD